MSEDWRPFPVAGGTVRVMLPAGHEPEDRDGIVSWTPDPAAGRFTVLTGMLSDGDGDELLAAERSGGEVDVEIDEDSQRGGLPVRRLRYRSRRHSDRVVLDRGSQGPEYAGDEDVESLADLLFVTDRDAIVRVGYSVLVGAAQATLDVLAETLARVRIGREP
jgi:hypothetical protein